MDLAPDGGDDPGDLEPENGRRTRGWRVLSGALQQVSAVDTGGSDLDEDLGGPWHRGGHLGPLKGFLRPSGSCCDGMHKRNTTVA